MDLKIIQRYYNEECMIASTSIHSTTIIGDYDRYIHCLLCRTSFSKTYFERHINTTKHQNNKFAALIKRNEKGEPIKIILDNYRNYYKK